MTWNGTSHILLSQVLVVAWFSCVSWILDMSIRLDTKQKATGWGRRFVSFCCFQRSKSQQLVLSVTRAPLASWSNMNVSVSNRSNFQLNRRSGTYLQLHQLVHHCTFDANEGDSFGTIVDDERSRVKSCVDSTGLLIPICIAHLFPNRWEILFVSMHRKVE